MVSFWISERLTQPLSSLKDAALRLAAGQLGTRVPVSGPTEIRRLATEFNHMSQVLDVRIQSLREQGRSLERERLLRELDREFGDESAQRTCPTLFLTRGAGTVDASGAAPTRGGGAVVWLSQETEHPEEALRLRATLHRLAQRLSAEAWLGLDLPGAMGKQGIHTVAVVSPDGAVTLRSARSGSVSLQGAGAPSRSPASVDAIRLGSGCRLALSAYSPAGATTFRAVLDPSGNGGGTP